jgi:excisionase family DNA binding protein
MTVTDTTHLTASDDDLRLLTIIEAAELLSVSRAGLYNLMTSGALTSIHIGRSRRIPVRELRRFITRAINSDH